MDTDLPNRGVLCESDNTMILENNLEPEEHSMLQTTVKQEDESSDEVIGDTQDSERNNSIPKHDKATGVQSEWEDAFTDSAIERRIFVLQYNFDTDVTFLIGSQAKRVRCHKQPLATASEVFKRMLYGNDGQGTSEEPVALQDISLDTFDIMLKYAYTGAEIQNLDQACTVLPAAKTYKLIALKRLCRSYLWSHLNVENVWKIVELAMENYEKNLYVSAMMIVQLYGSATLNSTAFEAVSSGTVSTILKLENINIDCEYTLLFAIIRWCKAEFQRRSNDNPAPTLRQIFEPFKTQIRFLNLTPQEFTSIIIDTDIFSKKEIYSLLLKLTLPDSIKEVPPFLNMNVNARTAVNACLYVRKQDIYTFGVNKKNLNEQGVLNDDVTQLHNDLYDLISTMYISINNIDDILYGVRVPNKEKFMKGIVEKVNDDDKLSVYVIDIISGICIYKITIKTSEISDTEKIIDIMFDEGINFSLIPLFNQREQIVSQIKIRIVIHESGFYPMYFIKSEEYEFHNHPRKPKNMVLHHPFQHCIIIAALLNK